MNGNQQIEVHYMNHGFPNTVPENYMCFFEDGNHAPTNYTHPNDMRGRDPYWSMNVNSYRYDIPAPASTAYHNPFEFHSYVPRMDLNQSSWEYPVMISERSSADTESGGHATPSMQAIPEECSLNHDSASSSQVVLQDDIDPDNMTYEELRDLGEAIGTQSRGLSQELIDLLPTSRYKSGGFFLRKKSAERCVICQMGYKRGDKQINLPCKHVYHAKCGSKWLRINKACPICNVEVVGKESSQ